MAKKSKRFKSANREELSLVLKPLMFNIPAGADAFDIVEMANAREKASNKANEEIVRQAIKERAELVNDELRVELELKRARVTLMIQGIQP